MCVYYVHPAGRNSPCRSEEDSPIRKNGPAKISIDHTYSENRYYYVLKIDFCNFLCFSTHEYNKAYDMKSNMKSSSVAGTHKREHKHMESHAPDLHVNAQPWLRLKEERFICCTRCNRRCGRPSCCCGGLQG